jgi:hypothetical protein
MLSFCLRRIPNWNKIENFGLKILQTHELVQNFENLVVELDFLRILCMPFIWKFFGILRPQFKWPLFPENLRSTGNLKMELSGDIACMGQKK